MNAKKNELIAEFLGSLFLTVAAITPMILFPIKLQASIGLAVLADSLAVSAVLIVLIEMFAPISGAHFNPVVSIMMLTLNRMQAGKTIEYITAQLLGGLTGLICRHLMFFQITQMLIHVSEITRSGGAYLGEILGTLLLLFAILLLIENNNQRIGLNIGVLVGGQLLATSSTMFANPMITIMRTFTYSAAGIRPFDSVIFILMQFIGLSIAVILWRQVEEA